MRAFRILIIGDFSGRRGRNHGSRKIETQEPVEIDRDSLDSVISSLGTSLTLSRIRLDSGVMLHFNGLDDFNPDSLLRQIDEQTPQVQDKKIERDAMERTPEERAVELIPEPLAPFPVIDLGAVENLLEATLARTEQKIAGTSVSPANSFDDYIQKIVAPHRVQPPSSAERRLLRESDDQRAELLRSVLHDPEFQRLEASWRALALLVERVETDEFLKVFLLDLSKEELIADIGAADDLASTALYSVIADERDKWAVVAADFVFDQEVEDLEMLRRLGLIAGSAGVPVIAEASQRMLGCQSVASVPSLRHWKRDASQSPAWSALRRSPVAQWIGLATPRFLGRLPYGESGRTIDSFAFEEMPDVRHESYLWASPVYLCAILLSQAFTVDGWEMRPGTFRNVSGLPLHVTDDGSGPEVKPCAEALLTESAGDRIMDLGIMPLMSIKEQGAVQLMRFQSIADPLTPLAGPWD